MKKILVFGASGDIGRYFIEYFKKYYSGNEYEVIAIGTRTTNFFKYHSIRYIQLDITNKMEFDKLPKNVFAVVDLAGIMPARMNGYNPFKYIDVNITGTLNILEFCRINKVDRILFAHSFGDIKDYGENEVVLKVDMQRKFSFTTDHSIYIMSKNFAVDMIENYHLLYGLKRFIFRLPTIYLYSPNDMYYVDGEIKRIGYRILIDRAIKGEPLEVWGDPNRVKDMVYVKDFCQMIYKALFVDRNNGFYNVGTGVGITLLDQIKGIIAVFSSEDHKSDIIMCPEKTNAPQYIMDITPAREELEYEPKYDYISMLKDFKVEMEKNTY